MTQQSDQGSKGVIPKRGLEATKHHKVSFWKMKINAATDKAEECFEVSYPKQNCFEKEKASTDSKNNKIHI